MSPEVHRFAENDPAANPVIELCLDKDSYVRGLAAVSALGFSRLFFEMLDIGDEVFCSDLNPAPGARNLFVRLQPTDGFTNRWRHWGQVMGTS